MSSIRVPFHQGLFSNAMVALIGREPDVRCNLGWDGYYHYRYTPRSEAEARQMQAHVSILQEWLSLFDILPFKSCCFYGRLPTPHTGEENNDYLEIVIVHPVTNTKD